MNFSYDTIFSIFCKADIFLVFFSNQPVRTSVIQYCWGGPNTFRWNVSNCLRQGRNFHCVSVCVCVCARPYSLASIPPHNSSREAGQTLSLSAFRILHPECSSLCQGWVSRADRHQNHSQIIPHQDQTHARARQGPDLSQIRATSKSS